VCGVGAGECGKGAGEARNGPVRRLAQRRLQLAERHLDGIEVGRVLGQIAKRSAARFNRFAYASSFVRRKIVDHDDILALEGGGQTLSSGECDELIAPASKVWVVPDHQRASSSTSFVIATLPRSAPRAPGGSAPPPLPRPSPPIAHHVWKSASA